MAACSTIPIVPFDTKIIEAQLALDLIGSSDMPKIAWDALEAGLDGPAIRRLAALDSPTYFEVRDVLPRAMQEMRLVKLTKREAVGRVARSLAQEVVERRRDPLKSTSEFRHLWVKAGYSREIQVLGTIEDDVYLARTIGGQSDDQIRQSIIGRLKDFIRTQETK